MKIIGITGGTGCGKTTALHVLQELGAYCIDCDAVYHELLETCPALRAEIVEAFPACAPGGVFDRKELGKLVFADQAALQRLNEITNGYVFAKVSFLLDEAARKGYPAAAIDAIGLLESGLTLLCHTTVAITAPREARLARLLARESISPAYAQARIDAQRTDEEFSALCRHTLHNDSTQAAFEAACRQLFTELLHERSFHCERE